MSDNTLGRFASSLRRVAPKLFGPLGALASITTIVIMVLVTIDVIYRNVVGMSVPGLLEMTESALVATVFLGLAYTGATNAHVSVDLLTEKLPLFVARRLAGIVWLLGSAMTIWLIYASTLRAIDSTIFGETAQDLMAWPLWPARWLVVVGYVAFLIVALINTYLSFLNEPLLGEDDEEHIAEGAHQTDMTQAVATNMRPDHRETQP